MGGPNGRRWYDYRGLTGNSLRQSRSPLCWPPKALPSSTPTSPTPVYGARTSISRSAAFGTDVIGQDGDDRRRLGAKVFDDPAARERLQVIVWPAMRRMMEERLAEFERQGVQLAALEAAVLIEADWLPLVDEVWVVEASPDVARQRLMAYKGLSSSEAQARLDAQISSEERGRHADVVIDNGGSLEETRRQVDRLWAGLRERASTAASSRSEGSSE
jgi:dephospho-CoA kinase